MCTHRYSDALLQILIILNRSHIIENSSATPAQRFSFKALVASGPAFENSTCNSPSPIITDTLLNALVLLEIESTLTGHANHKSCEMTWPKQVPGQELQESLQLYAKYANLCFADST